MAIKHDWIAEFAAESDPSASPRAWKISAKGHTYTAADEHEGIELRHKDVLDRVLAAFGLLLALPLMAVFCLLIKLTSRGPAFHSQDRVGKDGKVFRILKLRTMVRDAEQATGPVWATENDPRVTPIGRFLRRTHLDEVPQLWNVLQGDMSLVGPRPERPSFVEQFDRLIPNYRERLKIKPGITGLAQINHRYDATLHDVRTKLAYDLLYMKQMSLRTDLVIALKTVRCLSGTQARWPAHAPTPPLSSEAPATDGLSLRPEPWMQ